MKILFVMGTSQYDSTVVFMMEMAEQMQAAGWQIDRLDGRVEDGYEEQRASIIKNSYDVIFTINGMLLEEDSELGAILLQNRNVIYCTYLMDHPLVHYQRLQTDYPYVFVLSPDRHHTAYTDQYLPNIWGTAFLPHAGCQSQTEILPYGERSIDLSFMGSYVSLDQIRKEMDQYPKEMSLLMKETANLLTQEPERSLEEGIRICFDRYGISLQDQDMPAIAAEFRIVDRYIRSYFRDAVIRTLVEGGICVDIYGDGWEQFKTEARDCLRVHPPLSYLDSLTVIGNSKISLNVMPWFKDGSHDRVFTAMLNGAICLTDGSGYLEEQFQETENIYFYSLKGLKYLPAKIKKILDHPEQSKRVAENGRALAQRQHTWACRAEEVMEYLGQLMELKSSAVEQRLVQELYQEVVMPNQQLIRLLAAVIYDLRRQDYLHAMRRTTAILDQFSNILPQYIKWRDVINHSVPILEEAYLLSVLQEILDAQQKRDYVWLADLFALKLLPLIRSIQESYAEICDMPETEMDGYRVEPTSSGAYTLAVSKGQDWQYLHSNDNPYEEGRILAESWFDGEHYDYMVYGMGLGYHIQALLAIDATVTVTVLEADERILSLAKQFGLTDALQKTGRVQVLAVPEYAGLLQAVSEMPDTQRFVIHYPSLGQIGDPDYREQLEEYFIEYSSAQTQLPRLTGNWIRNQESFGQEVSLLQDRFQNKDVYIIAAGPSLDQNIQELHRVGEDGIVLATGTVFKKLLAEGIRVDYVIVIDAGGTTYTQTRDLQESTVPLLYLSTVYYKIPEEYPGEKYVIFQQGYAKSEDYAKEHGYETYESGGSVITTALEISIRMGARQIVLVGADLAYTSGRDHAAETAYVREIQQDNTCMTEDVNGNQVMTAKNFNIYRRWIEKRIQREREKAAGIRFIDATEGGARIRGTEIYALKDVVR